ncbi:cupin domain-containing protein [Gallaecimonas sp. GXIMD1310]|uniref:cupin domain-containing protein n=1 Tax=Gallaecimonas sp. GXIMD1310 TaxID=3131926 RepID=UPI00324DB13A
MADSPVINIQKLTYRSHGHGEDYFARVAPVAAQIGGQQLGYRVVRLPPGKKAWPRHSHLNNEEMFFVLEGRGTLYYSEQQFAVAAGDFIACPAGKEHAHQLENSGDKELVYLAVSTMHQPDVMLYPDSGKYGVIAGCAPGGDSQQRSFAIFGREDQGVNYWDGE